MRVGFVGMGKLGLPLAVATAAQGVRVGGFDVAEPLRRHRKYEHREGGYNGRPFQHLFDTVVRGGNLFFAQSLEHLAGWADLLFVVVQTPHDPEFEGVTRLPVARRDFDYTALRSAVLQLADHVRRDQTVVVMSTVLPGTTRRELLPALRGRCPLVYNPAFPAMGTVLKDFLEPEFVLLGGDDRRVVDRVAKYYGSRIVPLTCPVVEMGLESAELTKVAYNTFVSMKIGVANTLMEVCHKTPGADVDEVTGCLKLAHRRVCGPAYMDGGMGDGGGCHPRDNIAMSWLANQLDLSADLFGTVMAARELQAQWLVNLMLKYRGDLPLVILGKAYKPETNLTTGSAALLVANLLAERTPFTIWDPYVDPDTLSPLAGPPACFLVATKHERFARGPYPAGSVVIDPFRFVEANEFEVEVIRVGVGPKPCPYPHEEAQAT